MQTVLETMDMVVTAYKTITAQVLTSTTVAVAEVRGGRAEVVVVTGEVAMEQ
tara:strand:- start:50 stop:205 length:156 start_codon:yes stop_codon:yes gene_type:complete